jgi:hypothetical protein
MNKLQWSTKVGQREFARRAGGRRRYNTARQRQMWRRRFAILQIYALQERPPHGIQQALAERYGVHKAVISRDVAWAQRTGFAGSGCAPLRCSFRCGAVTIQWVNTAELTILRAARKWLKAARGKR